MAVRRWVFWLTVVATFVAATLPADAAPTLGTSDKINHIIAFVVLTGLACWAWPRARLLGVAAAMSAFGLAIELVQSIPALARDAEAADWAADTAAAAAVLLVVALMRRRSGLPSSARSPTDDML